MGGLSESLRFVNRGFSAVLQVSDGRRGEMSMEKHPWFPFRKKPTSKTAKAPKGANSFLSVFIRGLFFHKLCGFFALIFGFDTG